MKVKPEQVPPEVVKAARRAWDRSTSVQPDADLIAAAINAWPGMRIGKTVVRSTGPHFGVLDEYFTYIGLPIEETSDAE